MDHDLASPPTPPRWRPHHPPLVDGEVYWWEADGHPALLDPSARRVTQRDGRWVCRARDAWPNQPRLGRRVAEPVVYEAHVRGFNGTFGGMIDRLDHLSRLGVDVIELMPVHPFDPADNYWGYMPLVWGAVHEQFADPSGAADEVDQFAELVAACHERDIAVWLDVVFNHTGEGDATMPTRSLRGLANATSYRFRDDGQYTDDSGCGNDINPADPYVRALILEALERFAAIGVDGFRFDLASLLTRDGGGLVAAITEWGLQRDVVLIAEPWDLATYQLGGPQWPAPWRQWNDRFRDDIRSFVRGEPGLVPAVAQRIAGSDDIFGAGSGRTRTLNFVTAHDGLTMHDLTVVTSDRHRSWDCGDALRVQQVKNYMTFALLSRGAAMFVMGDECGRTQLGHDNPYDIDSPLTWMDWDRARVWDELTEFTATLVRLRALRGDVPPQMFGFRGALDDGDHSRSIAWHDGDLYVAANMWWEPLPCDVQAPGAWSLATSTAALHADAVAPRSIAIWHR